MALCHITGTVQLPDGTNAAGRILVFKRNPETVVAQSGHGIVPDEIAVKVAADGTVDFKLYTGNYIGFLRNQRAGNERVFKFPVPESATALFQDILEAVDPVEPLPSWLTEAFEARDDALEAELAAEEAADRAESIVAPFVATVALYPTPQAYGVVTNTPDAAEENFERFREMMQQELNVRVPAGEYYLKPKRISDGDFTKAIAIGEGGMLDLSGARIVSVSNSWEPQLNTQDYYYLFSQRSGSRLIGGVIDGDRQNIVSGPVTSMAFRAVQIFNGASDWILEKTTFRNIPSIGGLESFGLNTAPGSKRGSVLFVDAFNNDGTPIHIRGDFHASADGFVEDTFIQGGNWSNNVWHGLSCYGDKGTVIINALANGNLRCGFNFEFSTNHNIDYSLAQGNGQAGFRALGRSSGTWGNNNVSINNLKVGDATDSHGELTFRPSTWQLGPTPYQRLNVGRIIVGKMRVEPDTGNAHVYVRSDNTVTSAPTYPEGVSFAGDTSDWVFAYQGPSSTGYGVKGHIGPEMSFQTPAPVGTIYTGALRDYTLTSSMSMSEYSGSGNQSPDAITLTASAANQFSRTDRALLKRGKSYRVSIRYKTTDNNAWVVFAQDDASSMGAAFKSIRLDVGSVSVGNWVVASEIITVPSDRDCGIQVQQSSSTGLPSSIHVDWIAIDDLNAASIDPFEYFGASKKDKGVSAPSFGTWNQGDSRDNIAPSAGGVFSWICTTGGTFGSLSGVTASTTASSRDVTLSDASGINIGDYLSISGVFSSRKVTNVTGNIVQMILASGSTASGAAVSFPPPVFKAISLPS